MKIYIVSDLEGPAGVGSWRQTRVDGTTDKEKRGAMQRLTAEVNAAIEGIHDADPRAEIVVWDGHGTSGIIQQDVSNLARYIPHGVDQSMPEFDSSFDALMFVGQHAMAGTPNAPLCHTYSSMSIESFTLNGLKIGEFGCRAALAGEMGIPTIFLAGDDKACIEAKSLVHNIVTAQTKVGLGIESARHLSSLESCRLIREGAAYAVRQRAAFAPLLFKGPFVLRVAMLEGCSPDYFLSKGGRAIDRRTVEFNAARIRDLPV